MRTAAMQFSRAARLTRAIRHYSRDATAELAPKTETSMVDVEDIPCRNGGGFIRVLRLNSPSNRNAISRKMRSALSANIRKSVKWFGLAQMYILQQGGLKDSSGKAKMLYEKALRAEQWEGNGQRDNHQQQTDDVDEGTADDAETGNKKMSADEQGVSNFNLAESCLKPIRALVLGSAVDGTFCAGADLKERRHMNCKEINLFLENLRKLFTGIERSNIPTIAAVSGFALGGGFEMAMAHSLRVFSQSATVGLPETSLGIIPGAGGMYRLQKTVGQARATELVLSGRRLGAQEAMALNICQRLVETQPGEDEREKTIDAAVELAQEITVGAPLASLAAKHVLSFTKREDFAKSEKFWTAAIMKTKDRERALIAFAKKEKPVFEGN